MMSTKQHIELLREQITAISSRLDSLEESCEGEADAEETHTPASLDESSPNFAAYKPGDVPDSSGVKFTMEDEPKSAGNFLGMVAIFCFLLAAAFLIKLTINSGWLTPARQLALACTLGSTLVGCGFYFKRSDFAYISLLPATGIVILQMSAYSGHLYFELYNGWVAALLVGVVSAGSIYLFVSFRHQFFLLAAIVGTYLAPLIIPAMHGSTLDLMAYFAIWNICFGYLSISINNRTMTLIAAYFAIGVFAVLSHAALQVPSSELLTVILFQFVQFLIFLSAVCLYAMRRAPLSQSEAWAFIPLTLFFYGVEYHDIATLNATIAPYLGLCFAAVMLGAYQLTRKIMHKEHLPSAGLAWSIAAFVIFHAFYLELLPVRLTPWFALFVIASFPLLKNHFDLKGLHIGLLIVALLVVVLNYGKMIFGMELGEMSDMETTTLRFLFFGALLGGYICGEEVEVQQIKNPIFGILMATHLMAMVALSDLPLLFPIADSGDTLAGFLVSLLWAAYALGILVFSRRSNDRLLATSSLFIFGAAAGKSLVFDVANVEPMGRIACLLALGAALYIGGLLYRRITIWNTQPNETE